MEVLTRTVLPEHDFDTYKKMFGHLNRKYGSIDNSMPFSQSQDNENAGNFYKNYLF